MAIFCIYFYVFSSQILQFYGRKCGLSPMQLFLMCPCVISVFMEVKGQGKMAIFVNFCTFLLNLCIVMISNISKYGLSRKQTSRVGPPQNPCYGSGQRSRLNGQFCVFLHVFAIFCTILHSHLKKNWSPIKTNSFYAFNFESYKHIHEGREYYSGPP